MIKVEQYVMAYRGNHDEIKKLVPEGFESLRPVLRLNAEIVTVSSDEKPDGSYLYVEFNTPVSGYGKRGWMNLGSWDSFSVPLAVGKEEGTAKNGYRGNATTFEIKDLLKLTYQRAGVEGGCPAENDNDGCFFFDMEKDEAKGFAPGELPMTEIKPGLLFRTAEKIQAGKEYCDCDFKWSNSIKNMLESIDAGELEGNFGLRAFRAMAIENEEILGAYVVSFTR